MQVEQAITAQLRKDRQPPESSARLEWTFWYALPNAWPNAWPKSSEGKIDSRVAFIANGFPE